MTRTRWAWGLALLPLVAGMLATALALALGDRRVLIQETTLAWTWLAVGAAVTAAVLIVIGIRRGLRRAERRGRTAATVEERDNRRRFVDRLDHELKNPLTAIRVGVSNLDDQRVGAALESQVVRLSRVLADLRKLGELESAPLEIAPVDLEQVASEVREAIDELPEAGDRAISLIFPRAPRPLPAVRGDADLLFLAIYNVVANAVKYAEPGDRIEVRGSDGDGSVSIEVADTGRGIPDAEQELVWEELSRGSLTRAIPGSGLGLPFVRAIVARHGGSVSLRSRVGEGTVVTLSLPV